jgi:hypothetical protein
VDWLAQPKVASAPPTVASLLERRSALVAGLVGAQCIAVVTVVDRVLTDPHLYERLTDAAVHLAAETTANALFWAATWSLLRATGMALRASGVDWRASHISTVVAPLLFGALIGPAACKVVVRHSILWHVLPGAVWWLASVVFGVALAAGLRAALLLRVSERTKLAGTLLVVPALGVHFYTLHHYLWQYGNLHFLAQLCVVVLVATVLTLVLRRVALSRALAWPVACALAASFVVLTASAPSQASRRAVTVWGAGARHALLRVAWPVVDRDGDGVPASLWGMDADDGDPSVTPLSGGANERVAASRAMDLRLQAGTPRNLLFLIVDTVRLDSFERLLRENAAVRSAFEDFAYYPNFMSCSSRTQGALPQLLGDARCDPRSVGALGPRSLVEILRERGFQAELVTYFPPIVRFSKNTQLIDDDELIGLALRSVSKPSSSPKAIFVHLQSGHAPHGTFGVTSREIYEQRVTRSFDALSRFVDALPKSWAVVIVGDHGEAFGEHSTFGHATTLYEEVLRTPLLVRAPRLAPGRKADALGCPDVAWLALYGLDVLESDPGPLPYQYAALDLESSRNPRRDSIRALKVGSTKVVWRPWLGTWELYDLHEDPAELRSLVEARPREFASLRAELESVSRRCERR